MRVGEGRRVVAMMVLGEEGVEEETSCCTHSRPRPRLQPVMKYVGMVGERA